MTDQNSTPNSDENSTSADAASNEAPAIDFGAGAPEAPVPAPETPTYEAPTYAAPAAAEAPAAPAAPQAPAYGAAPTAPAYGAPEAPAYGAPAAPAAPAYGAPAAGFGAPAAPGYGAPQAPGYGAPQQNGPAREDELSELTLNLWLSVFFQWIPALIFYVMRKDTASPLVRKALTDNLNWQIVSLLISFVSGLLMIVGVGFITVLVPFVFSIIHAATVPGQIRAGQTGKFYLTPSWVK